MLVLCTEQKKGAPGQGCEDMASQMRTRQQLQQQRIILPVHYPGRVHRASQVTAYPTRTSMDPHGNPITVLTVDQHGEAPAFLRSYQPIHLDHTLNAHQCGVEHRACPPPPPHPFRRPKFSGHPFSKPACFSQYETVFQHYYFQGLSYPEQTGQLRLGVPTKGPSRAFPPVTSRLFPPVVHVAPSSRLESGSASSFSCYHGHRSVCSGYLADCPGSDSSSSSGSAQCRCSSTDSMVDCTEVSNQGVYGSCSTFRSSLSSDYDPYVYRSKSPCRGGEVSGTSRGGAVVLLEGPHPLSPPGGECLPGDHLSHCSLEMNYSSSSSLEHREGPSLIPNGGVPETLPAEVGQSCTGSREPACTCPFEAQHAPQEALRGRGTDCCSSRLLLGPPLWAGCSPGPELQAGPTQGLYSLRTEGGAYEALPCCFYEEKQVAGCGGVPTSQPGCYAEDYAVNVQYMCTATEDPGPGCFPTVCDLGPRISIIPEDRDCKLALTVDCPGSGTWEGPCERIRQAPGKAHGEREQQREPSCQPVDFPLDEALGLFPSPALSGLAAGAQAVGKWAAPAEG